MRLTKSRLFIILTTIPMLTYALDNPEVVVPMKSVFESISDLVKNFKGLTSIGVFSAILVIIIQFLKTDVAGNFLKKLTPTMKRIIITVLGQVSGILIAVVGGMGWVDAIIAGLLTSGGAIAIFEVFKPLFEKKNGL